MFWLLYLYRIIVVENWIFYYLLKHNGTEWDAGADDNHFISEIKSNILLVQSRVLRLKTISESARLEEKDHRLYKMENVLY